MTSRKENVWAFLPALGVGLVASAQKPLVDMCAALIGQPHLVDSIGFIILAVGIPSFAAYWIVSFIQEYLDTNYPRVRAWHDPVAQVLRAITGTWVEIIPAEQEFRFSTVEIGVGETSGRIDANLFSRRDGKKLRPVAKWTGSDLHLKNPKVSDDWIYLWKGSKHYDNGNRPADAPSDPYGHGEITFGGADGYGNYIDETGKRTHFRLIPVPKKLLALLNMEKGLTDYATHERLAKALAEPGSPCLAEFSRQLQEIACPSPD